MYNNLQSIVYEPLPHEVRESDCIECDNPKWNNYSTMFEPISLWVYCACRDERILPSRSRIRASSWWRISLVFAPPNTVWSGLVLVDGIPDNGLNILFKRALPPLALLGPKLVLRGPKSVLRGARDRVGMLISSNVSLDWFKEDVLLDNLSDNLLGDVPDVLPDVFKDVFISSLIPL